MQRKGGSQAGGCLDLSSEASAEALVQVLVVRSLGKEF
jgi:hypothetical protein